MTNCKPTDNEIADYTLKAALCRLDFAFDFIRQYKAAWKFPAVFISDEFQHTIQAAAEYAPLNSPWSIRAHILLRHTRFKTALVVMQRGSSSTFWNNVPHFLACHLATSLMQKGQYAFGHGTRGGDIIDLSLYSPSSDKASGWNYHSCDSDGFREEFFGSSLEKYRNTIPCLGFDDFSGDAAFAQSKTPLNHLSQCKNCGLSFLSTADFEPSALDRMHRHILGGCL